MFWFVGFQELYLTGWTVDTQGTTDIPEPQVRRVSLDRLQMHWGQWELRAGGTAAVSPSHLPPPSTALGAWL